jgi:hypothetical protein
VLQLHAVIGVQVVVMAVAGQQDTLLPAGHDALKADNVHVARDGLNCPGWGGWSHCEFAP